MTMTAEQLEYRRRYVCGSDAGDVMAGKWLDLWKIKTGQMPEPDLYDKLSPTLDYFVLKHFTRERLELTRLLGHATEPLNRFWYTQQTGRAVERASEWATADAPLQFMGAHLDGVSTTSRGYPCYWDAKWTGRADEAFVLRHTAQGVHNATILGFDWWGLSVFIGNGKWEWIEQEIDPLYQASLIAKEREFWGYVTRGEEPPAPPPVAPPKPQPKRREINLDLTPAAERPNWSGEFARLARSFAETDGAAKLHAITRKEMAELVPDDVGLAQLGLVRFKRDGRGVQISLQKTGGGDAEPR
jgi:hypothetical protein